MKLKNLREEIANTSNGGFTDESPAPNAGLSPVMGFSGRSGKKKKNEKDLDGVESKNAINKQAVKDMMQKESKMDYSTFRNTMNSIDEWYISDYKVSFLDTDGKKKMYVVDGGKTTVKTPDIKNDVGYEPLKTNDKTACPKCGSIDCRCNTKSKNYKVQNLKNRVDESTLTEIDYETLEESGGKVIDSLQKAAESGEKVVVTHEDGTRTIVDSITARAVVEVYDELDDSNRVKFINNANGSARTFKEIASFAKNK